MSVFHVIIQIGFPASWEFTVPTLHLATLVSSWECVTQLEQLLVLLVQLLWALSPKIRLVYSLNLQIDPALFA